MRHLNEGFGLATLWHNLNARVAAAQTRQRLAELPEHIRKDVGWTVERLDRAG